MTRIIRARKGAVALFQLGGLPIGKPPTHTMGNNGALTLGTALNFAFPECYMYFAANQIATGVPAGLYYVTMSSTTVGTVYNNTYTSGVPSTPAVLVPFVTTGPGANTGSTSEITVYSDTFPGNFVRKNSQFRTTYGIELPSNTNSKQFFEKINGQIFGQNDIQAATGNFSRLQTHTFFQGSPARQTNSAKGAFSPIAPNRQTVDMSSNQPYTISLQTAVATDYMFLTGLLVEVFP